MTEPTSRRVVFVVGSGRSGTSTMAGTLRTLGLHVPQPEVVADATNPKGFGEPRWVVDLHAELLARSNVQVSDARPRAWLDTGTTSGDHATRERVTAWLEQQFDLGDELVIKDPRAAWFLGLWRAAADRCGATSSYVTMLRPVTEVVGSKQTYYGPTGGRGGAGSDQGAVTRTAAWVNMMLHTERATRGQQRAFVHYGDLLEDWTQPVFALGRGLRPRRGEDRDGRRHRRGAPLHRPVAAAGDDDVGRHRRARAAPGARRRDLAGARRDRPRRLDRPPGAVRPAARRLRRAVRRGGGVRPLDGRRPAARGRRGGPARGRRDGRSPAAAPTACPTPSARWCRPRPGRSCARRSAGSARPSRIGPDARHRLPRGGPGVRRHVALDVRRTAGPRADVRLPGPQRGAQPAVGAAADLRGRPARAARRQRLGRRHGRRRARGGRGVRRRRPADRPRLPPPRLARRR